MTHTTTILVLTQWKSDAHFGWNIWIGHGNLARVAVFMFQRCQPECKML